MIKPVALKSPVRRHAIPNCCKSGPLANHREKKTLIVQIYLGNYHAAQFYLETSLVGLKVITESDCMRTKSSQIAAQVYFKLFSKGTTELYRGSTKPTHASQIKNE